MDQNTPSSDGAGGSGGPPTPPDDPERRRSIYGDEGDPWTAFEVIDGRYRLAPLSEDRR